MKENATAPTAMHRKKWVWLALCLIMGGWCGWFASSHAPSPKVQLRVVGLDKDGLCVIEVFNSGHEALCYIDDGPLGPDYRIETFLDGKWKRLNGQIAMCGNSQTNKLLPPGQKLTFKVAPSPAGCLRIGIFLWPESHKFTSPIRPEWLPKAANKWWVEWHNSYLRRKVARFTFWSDELPNQRIDTSAPVQPDPFEELGASSSASTR